MNIKFWSASSPCACVEDVCVVLNLDKYDSQHQSALTVGHLSPGRMVVHCEPFLQERYFLLRVKTDPESRLILSQPWCEVLHVSGVRGLGVEGHIQDSCVLVSSLSVLERRSYHNPPPSISRVNPCNVRLEAEEHL